MNIKLYYNKFDKFQKKHSIVFPIIFPCSTLFSWYLRFCINTAYIKVNCLRLDYVG